MVSMHFTKFCFTNWNHTFIGLKIALDCQINPYVRLIGIYIQQYGWCFANFFLNFILFNTSIDLYKFFLLPFEITYKFQWLPFEMMSLCCVWSRIKWQHRDLLKPLQRKEKKCLKLNSNKTLKVNQVAAKIFKEYLKENANFLEFDCVKKT